MIAAAVPLIIEIRADGAAVSRGLRQRRELDVGLR
jgi:hypothetical protein